MKSIALSFILGLLGLSLGAHASNYIKVDGPVVKVNSFAAVGAPGSELGEVCGTVTGANGAVVNLKVMADYNSNNPGEYHTFSGPSGNFCELIHTYYGTVEVTLLSATGAISTTAKLTNKTRN